MIAITIVTDLPYARRDCGWGALQTDAGRLPLAAVDIDARVVGLTSTTVVRQTFVNHGRVPTEATYIFPLPDRHAVERFRMVAGDRVIEGQLDERGAARDAYERALWAGQVAAIAEEDRAGVFSLRVGNLMPGAVVSIELTLSGPVVIDDGEVTWLFPLVVAQRYIPGAPLPGEQAGLGIVGDTDQVPDASRISPPVLLPGMPNPVRLGVRLHIDGGGLPITRLRCNLSEVDARTEGHGWQVTLRPGQRLDRDLVLRWSVGAHDLCSSAVWAPDRAGAGATVAVTIVPPIASAATGRPRDVVIVLDRSGSMGGWKMVAARRAAARIVDSLTERDRFSVIAFDDRLDMPARFGHSLWPGADRNRFHAVEFLSQLTARGGTELATPLSTAATMLPADHTRDQVLVLVTDGQVGNEDAILAHLGGRLGTMRVFTLGIDQAVNAAFLRRLAGLGGGACELVESEDRLDEVMAKIHRRIATPIMSDLALTGGGLDPASQSPRRLPAVFAGAPVTVYLRTASRPRPGDTVEISGRLPAGGAITLRAPIDSVPFAVNLESTWARARIRDLEDQYAAGTGNQDLERVIVATSLTHGVLSRFTAFVAIDRSTIANPGGNPRSIVQPVEPTHSMPDMSSTVASVAGVARGRVPGMPSAAPMAPRASSSYVPSGFTPPPPSMAPTQPGPGGRYESKDQGAFKTVASAASPPPARHEMQQRKSDAGADHESGSALSRMIDRRPYLHRVELIATDLQRALTEPQPDRAAQLPIARLIELCEDARSVGLDQLAEALAPLLVRLQNALGDPTFGSVATAVVAELLAIGRAQPPNLAGRKPFWK